MTLLLFIALGIVLASISVLLPKYDLMWIRKRRWWKLSPSPGESNFQPENLSFALNGLRRAPLPAHSLMIVRVGDANADSQIWVSTRSKHGHAVTEQVAKAAGCESTECDAPRALDRIGGWRISYVRSNGASNNSEPPTPDNCYLKALATNLSSYLGNKDAIVLTLIPHGKGINVKARAVIRASGLRSPWAYNAKTGRCFWLPSMIAVPQVLVAAFCLFRVVGEFSAFDYSVPYLTSEVSALVAVLVLVLSVFGLKHELWPRRRIKLLTKYWYFPPGIRLRTKSEPISAKHLAAWVRVQ